MPAQSLSSCDRNSLVSTRTDRDSCKNEGSALQQQHLNVIYKLLFIDLQGLYL